MEGLADQVGRVKGCSKDDHSVRQRQRISDASGGVPASRPPTAPIEDRIPALPLVDDEQALLGEDSEDGRKPKLAWTISNPTQPADVSSVERIDRGRVARTLVERKENPLVPRKCSMPGALETALQCLRVLASRFADCRENDLTRGARRARWNYDLRLGVDRECDKSQMEMAETQPRCDPIESNEANH
jgi:hypothetical protein